MSTTSVPPRFVPTLTDVVSPSGRAYASQVHSPLASMVNANPEPNLTVAENLTGVPDSQVEPLRTDDVLFKRVMLQVDVVLERRLREALGRVILEQTQALAPQLRNEIELVVKESIGQAMAQALTDR